MSAREGRTIARQPRPLADNPFVDVIKGGEFKAPLLDSVDYAVVIKGINRQGITLRDDNPARVYHTQQPGPAGWQEGLDHFLS